MTCLVSLMFSLAYDLRGSEAVELQLARQVQRLVSDSWANNLGFPAAFSGFNEYGGQRDETGHRIRRDPIADMGLVTVDGLTPSVTAISRISV